MLTQKRLQEFLRYEPETGSFTWLVCPSHRVKAGHLAGSLDRKDGITIRLFGKLYRAHRLAWLYMTGYWPSGEIDHRNGINIDNRWENLRDVSHGINMQNRHQANVDNRVKLLGVSRGGRGWRARIKLHGMAYHLGVFDTPEQAHQVYLFAKRRLHEGCTI